MSSGPLSLHPDYGQSDAALPRGGDKTASTGAECDFFKATDGMWYMSLEDMDARPDDGDGGDEDEDSDWRDSYDPVYEHYGPFPSLDVAIKYLNRNFANPGGWSLDDSGRRKPPRKLERLNRWGSMVRRVASLYRARFSHTHPVRSRGVEAAVTDVNPFDGQRKLKVRDVLNRLMAPHIKGNFRDQYWTPIQNIRKVFEKENIPAILLKAEYQTESGVPTSKVWVYEVPFVNQNGRDDKVFIHITASGAGSVEEPLEVYDVTAYAA